MSMSTNVSMQYSRAIPTPKRTHRKLPLRQHVISNSDLFCNLLDFNGQIHTQLCQKAHIGEYSRKRSQL